MGLREDIQALLVRLPEGLRADWDATNHYEMATPTEPFWLDLPEDTLYLWGPGVAPVDWSRTDTGRKVGLLMDAAAAYRPHVEALLAEVARLEAQNARLKATRGHLRMAIRRYLTVQGQAPIAYSAVAQAEAVEAESQALVNLHAALQEAGDGT